MIKTGEKAPEFCLKDAQEKEVCLRNFEGSFVVLYFYPKDNTPGCTIEAKDFTKELPGFEELNAVVLGVSADSCEAHRKFIKGQKLKITLLSDESKETLKEYGVWQKKSLMGKEYMGIERTTYLIGPKGKVLKVWEKVNPAGHAKEVKAAMQTVEEK
jgi:thioredoxin-dependent peroxiredoxin